MKDESLALNEEIQKLQAKQALELIVLREQFYVAYESLKPINLIKNTFKQVVTSPDIKNNLLNGIIGLATGFISKKILIGGAAGPVKKMMGSLLQVLVTNFVSRHSEKVKQYGEVVLTNIFRKKNEHDENYHDSAL